MHALHRLWLAFAERRRDDFLLILVLACLFTSAFAMALIFTQTIAHIERLERIHARYYGFVFPAFVILAAALPPALVRHRAARASIAIALGLVALVTLYSFSRFSTAAFGIDNGDMAWLNLRLLNEQRFYVFVAILFAALVYAAWQTLRSLNFSRTGFFVFYTVFALIASYGQRWNTEKSIALFHASFPAERQQIVSHIGDFSNQVILVEDGFARRCNYVFWLPYQYVGVLELKPRTPLPEYLNRPNSWLLVVGDFDAWPGYKERHAYPAFTLYRY